MSIYHCSISNVSRASGSSACATLSYIQGGKIYEERTQKTYSYGRKERVLETGTIIPEYAPKEYQNPSVLFNAIENYEKTENARTAKKIEVAFPRELDFATQRKVIEDFIRNNLTVEGYCATFAIHNGGKNANPHAHILVANRQINEKGEWNSKRKMEYALDENDKRIPRLDENGQQKTDKNGRKQWVRINAEQNPLDKKLFLSQLREGWAIECNKHLHPEQQIDHRSYEAQGKDQIPTIHEGYASRRMEARGQISDRAEVNRSIRDKNRLIRQITEEAIRLSYEKTQIANEPQNDDKWLREQIQTLLEQAKHLKEESTTLEKKIRAYKDAAKHLITVQRGTALREEATKMFFFSRRKFLKIHKDELGAVEIAKKQLEAYGVHTNVDPEKVMDLVSQKEAEHKKLIKEAEAINERILSLEKQKATLYNREMQNRTREEPRKKRNRDDMEH